MHVVVWNKLRHLSRRHSLSWLLTRPTSMGHMAFFFPRIPEGSLFSIPGVPTLKCWPDMRLTGSIWIKWCSAWQCTQRYILVAELFNVARKSKLKTVSVSLSNLKEKLLRKHGREMYPCVLAMYVEKCLFVSCLLSSIVTRKEHTSHLFAYKCTQPWPAVGQPFIRRSLHWLILAHIPQQFLWHIQYATQTLWTSLNQYNCVIFATWIDE